MGIGRFAIERTRKPEGVEYDGVKLRASEDISAGIEAYETWGENNSQPRKNSRSPARQY